MAICILLYAAFFTSAFGIYMMSVVPESGAIRVFEILPLPIAIMSAGLIGMAATLMFIYMGCVDEDDFKTKAGVTVFKASCVLALLSAIAISVIHFNLRNEYGESGFFTVGRVLKVAMQGVELSAEPTSLVLTSAVLSFFVGLPLYMLFFSGADFGKYITVTTTHMEYVGSYESKRSEPHLLIAQFIIGSAVVCVPILFLFATPIIYFIAAGYGVVLASFFKKKPIIIATAVILCCSAIVPTVLSLKEKDNSIGYYTETEGLVYAINERGTGYEVTGYIGNAIEIYIPDTHEGLPVVGIAKEAFYEQKEIISVYISDNIKYIGEQAFAACFSLRRIDYSENCSLEEIGVKAFYTCDSLKDIVFPKSLKVIDKKAFWICDNLKSISFEEGAVIEVIDEEAFLCCESLKKVTLPSSIRRLGINAFSRCEKLEKVTVYKSEYLTNEKKDFLLSSIFYLSEKVEITFVDD